MDQFELIFVCNMLLQVLFLYGCPIVPVSFVENTVHYTLNCLCPFVKNQLIISEGQFHKSVFCLIGMCVCPFANATLSRLL